MGDKKFRIISNGEFRGTKLYFGEEDISSSCTGISLDVSADGINAGISILVKDVDIQVIKDAVIMRYFNKDWIPLEEIILEEIEKQILKEKK